MRGPNQKNSSLKQMLSELSCFAERITTCDKGDLLINELPRFSCLGKRLPKLRSVLRQQYDEARVIPIARRESYILDILPVFPECHLSWIDPFLLPQSIKVPFGAARVVGLK